MDLVFRRCNQESCLFSGLEPRGNVVLEPAEFLVETVEAGLGEVLVYVEDPEGHTEEVQLSPGLLSGVQHSAEGPCVSVLRPAWSPTTTRPGATRWSTCPKWRGSTK